MVGDVTSDNFPQFLLFLNPETSMPVRMNIILLNKPISCLAVKHFLTAQ